MIDVILENRILEHSFFATFIFFANLNTVKCKRADILLIHFQISLELN